MVFLPSDKLHVAWIRVSYAFVKMSKLTLTVPQNNSTRFTPDISTRMIINTLTSEILKTSRGFCSSVFDEANLPSWSGFGTTQRQLIWGEKPNLGWDEHDMVLNGGFRRENFFQLACFCIFYFAMEVNYNLRFQYIALVLGPLDNSEIFLHLSNFYHDLYLGNYHWATYSF